LPRLEILPAAQRRLWSELGEVPDEFTLYGGTAIALHLGHRESVDFAFCGTKHFDPDRLLRSVAFLSLAEVIQRQADALTVRVERDGPVLISFFATPQPGRIDRPMIAPENGLKIAGLIDLAGMKADVVQKRAEAKDDLDIDALMPRRHCPAKGSRRSQRAAGGSVQSADNAQGPGVFRSWQSRSPSRTFEAGASGCCPQRRSEPPAAHRRS